MLLDLEPVWEALVPAREARSVFALLVKFQNDRASVGGVQMLREQTLHDTVGWPPAPVGAALPSMDDGVNESSVTNPHDITIKCGHRKHKRIGGVG